MPAPNPEKLPLPAQEDRRYLHVIWDWNGTLLDDVAYSADLMNTLLARNGLPAVTLARYRAIFDFPVRVYYEHLGFDLSADGAFERLGREWTDAYEASRFACPLHAGAREILAAVRAAEYTQSILSAYPMERLKEIVGHFGLTGHFMQVLGLDDIWARSKVELGHRWLAELALPPSRVILIGDTVHDWDVAQALGIDCALVATGHQSVERLRRKTARVFDSLAELPGVLRIPAAG